MDSATVTIQPSSVYSYNDSKYDKTVKYSHKCRCERCLFGKNENKECCPRGISDWCDFRMYVGGGQDDGCGTCTVLCFPINFAVKLLFCFPCASYNSFRNWCNNTKNLNYIC